MASVCILASGEGRGDNFALLLPKVGIKPPDTQLFLFFFFNPFKRLFGFIERHPLQERTGVLSCLRFSQTPGFPTAKLCPVQIWRTSVTTVPGWLARAAESIFTEKSMIAESAFFQYE